MVFVVVVLMVIVLNVLVVLLVDIGGSGWGLVDMDGSDEVC